MSSVMDSEDTLLSEDDMYVMDTFEERTAYFDALMRKQGIKGRGREIYLEYLIDVKLSDAYRIRRQDLEVLEKMLEEEREKQKEAKP